MILEKCHSILLAARSAAAVDKVEEIDHEEHPQDKQNHQGLVNTVAEVQWFVLWVNDGVGVYPVGCFVEEHLPVAEAPVAKNKHEKWCMLEDKESILIELLVVHRWALIIVREAEPFDNVHVEYSKECDRKQKWDAHAVHEADKDLHDNRRILEVHHVLWSRIQVDVLLLRFLLRPEAVQLAPTAVASTVSESAQDFERVENQKLNIWKYSHDQHRFDKGGRYIDIPVLPKVRILVLNRNELQNRVFQIGIREKQNDSCVDERCDENGCHD